jgi:RNase H-fold protein (predicted Holliday junction resolvase)
VSGGAVIGGALTGGAVIAVDPGRIKAGYAVLDSAGDPLDSGICPVESLAQRLRTVVATHTPAVVALGRGTNAKPVAEALAALGLPIRWVDEYETTRRARDLFFTDHPPRGWRRLLPRGLQVPDRPIDDYAAILIGRRYLGTTDAPPARGDA